MRKLVNAFLPGATAFALLSFAAPVHAQRLLERTPNLPNAVTALPGVLEVSLPHRFAHFDDPVGLETSTTFDLALGLPYLLPLRWTAGVRFAPASAVVPDESDEWELYERLGLLRQSTDAPLDLTLTAAWNLAARSIDGEAVIARTVGPLRLLAAGRVLSSAFGGDDARFAVAGGVVWHVAPRRMPVTLAADVATLTDREAGEELAWSAGAQIGLPYTPFQLSLQASNAATTTLQGASLGRDDTRYGFELNLPVEFVGFIFGMFTPRERALESVTELQAPVAGDVARVTIRGYRYTPATLRIRAGDVVEWVNEDAVVHTVSAENGAFESGGIRPGATWRARFTEPGLYPYYCGPHPFMKAIVIVTPR